MSVADEFVERRMFKFACYKCDHPAMLITKREELSENTDGSKQLKISLACPRCKAKDEFILNDGSEAATSVSVNSDIKPDPKMII